VKTSGREVCVAGLSQAIREIFQLLNFPSIFMIYDTVQDAMEALEKKNREA